MSEFESVYGDLGTYEPSVLDSSMDVSRERAKSTTRRTDKSFDSDDSAPPSPALASSDLLFGDSAVSSLDPDLFSDPVGQVSPVQVMYQQSAAVAAPPRSSIPKKLVLDKSAVDSPL
jgi:hypothetical protein